MPFADRDFEASGSTPIRPFISIAQQVGAECVSLPQRLADVLNEGSRAPKWSHWDQELIEKVSTDSKIPAELIASLDTAAYSWVDDILCGISGRPDELIVFHRLKEAFRELACSGHVILVGHGSTYMTHDLATGLHLRLIAPMDFRIEKLAARLNLPAHKAAQRLRRLDKRRKAFFTRFWPGRPLGPETFAAVINIAELDEERVTRAVVAMLPRLVGE